MEKFSCNTSGIYSHKFTVLFVRKPNLIDHSAIINGNDTCRYFPLLPSILAVFDKSFTVLKSQPQNSSFTQMHFFHSAQDN